VGLITNGRVQYEESCNRARIVFLSHSCLDLDVGVLLCSTAATRTVHNAGNPILSDDSYYSPADPTPIVVGDTLHNPGGQG